MGSARTARITAVALLAVYIVVGLATLTTFPLVWSDEGWYVQSAWSFVRDGAFSLSMFADLAGFDADNVVYGRLYLGLLAAAFSVGDLSPEVARSVSFASGIVAVVAMYGLGRELWNERVGFVAAMLLAVAPVFIDQSHDARPEIMQVAVTLVAFYLMLVGERRASAVVLVLAGVLASLAADVHLNGIIVPVALLAVLLVRRAPRRALAWFVAGTAMGGLWVVVAHLLPDPELFVEQTRTYSPSSPLARLVEEPIVVIGLGLARFARVDVGSLALLVVGLAATYELLRRHNDLALRSVLTFAAVTFLFMTFAVSNKQPIYAILLWPVLALLVARLIDVVRPRLAIATGGVIVIVSLGSVGYMAIRDRDADFGGYLARLQAVIPDDAVVMGQPSAWFGFADQPYLASQYFSYVGPFADEMRRHGVEYVIADEYLLDLQLHQLEELPAVEVEAFLAEHGEVVAEIEDPFYGRLQSADEPTGSGTPPYVTRVYRIAQPGPSDQP